MNMGFSGEAGGERGDFVTRCELLSGCQLMFGMMTSQMLITLLNMLTKHSILLSEISQAVKEKYHMTLPISGT